jgi:glycosyltransferase involved in cell wall biosynthesis
LQNKFGGSLLPHCRDTSVLDPQKFNPDETKEKLGLTGRKILMFLGTPRPHKGVDDLLAALKMIDNPDLRLVVIGVENEQEFLRGVDGAIRDRVVVLPKTPFDKLPEYLSAADILAIPQRRTSDSIGQMPAKIFDAMAMAKPILATRISDIPEVLGDCGYLVDPGEPARLADAIQYILSHPDEARKKAVAARERCQQMYDMKNLELGLRDLVEQVTSAKGGA